MTGCPSGESSDDDDDGTSPSPTPRCTFPAEVSSSATTFGEISVPTMNCGIDTLVPGVTGYAAVTTTVFAGSSICGSCLEVTGAASTRIVQVVGECSGCEVYGSNALDINEAAFTEITGNVDGVRDITWRPVPCDSAPVIRCTMDGANPFFANLRVLDARTPVASVAMLVSSTSIDMTRTSFNTWQLPGGNFPGDGPYELTLTDLFGESIVQAGVPLMTNGTSFTGNVQFSDCD